MNPNRIYRFLIPFFLLLLVFSSLTAQIRVSAIIGIQSTNLNEKNSLPGFDSASGKYYSSNTGFELGVLAEIPLGKYNLFLQPGILYSAKGNQYQYLYDSSAIVDTQYTQHTLNLSYVEIPLYLTWKLPLSKNLKDHFYVSAGPYFAFIYSVNQSYQNRVLQYNSSNYIYNSGSTDLPVGNGQGAYKTFDIGIGARAGFELGNVMIGVYYSSGLTNVYTASYPSIFHNNVIGGSLSIWLNKPKPVAKPIFDIGHYGIPIPVPLAVSHPSSPMPDTVPILPPPPSQTTVTQRAQLIAADVIFQVNSSKLIQSSYPALKEIGDSLKAYADLDLVIEGHTDNTGRPAYNMKLSVQRAEAVRKVLLGYGVPENRVTVKGFGDTKPVADNSTGSGKAKNRRVVFAFQLKNR
jgi:outer membrane protein OmpA-like peptidoglycan-associated protein